MVSMLQIYITCKIQWFYKYINNKYRGTTCVLQHHVLNTYLATNTITYQYLMNDDDVIMMFNNNKKKKRTTYSDG